MQRYWVLSLLLCFVSIIVKSQVITADTVQLNADNLTKVDATIKATIDSVAMLKGKAKFMPVPKTATRFALIPGGGQIYNRDYWKLPIIYLGIGSGI